MIEKYSESETRRESNENYLCSQGMEQISIETVKIHLAVEVWD